MKNTFDKSRRHIKGNFRLNTLYNFLVGKKYDRKNIL
jgi:hypothetical protein